MLMNRVQPRRPPEPGPASGGYAGAAASSAQPERTAGVAPVADDAAMLPDADLGATMPGEASAPYGALPMPPLPPPPPGSNLPLALEGSSLPQTREVGMSNIGGVAPGQADLFGGGGGGMSEGAPDPAFLQQILAGLPGGRR